MDKVPVTLKFIQERKNKKTGIHPFYLEVDIPLEGRPKMLPTDRAEHKLYATEVAADQPDRVKLRFTFTPAAEGSVKAELLVAEREVLIWATDASPWMEETWKERRIVRTVGTLEHEEDTFFISFSARRAA